MSTNVKFDGMIDDIAKVISCSVVCEKEVQVKDGKWYQMIIKPYIRQHKNIVDGVIITFNDITLQKSVQENLIANNANSLKQKNKELMIINNDLDGFIYTASHDLQSPISNLEGLLSVISKTKAYEVKELNPYLK